MWIWRKSVQRFPRYFIHKQKSRLTAPKKNLPYFTGCGNKNNSVYWTQNVLVIMTTAQQICVPYLYCLALYQKTPGPCYTVAARGRGRWARPGLSKTSNPSRPILRSTPNFRTPFYKKLNSTNYENVVKIYPPILHKKIQIQIFQKTGLTIWGDRYENFWRWRFFDFHGTPYPGV